MKIKTYLTEIDSVREGIWPQQFGK